MKINYYRWLFITFIYILFFSLIVSPSLSHAKPDPKLFEVPIGLKSQVNFWIKVYSEYTTNQVIIHDADNLDIIYEIINFDGQKNLSQRKKSRQIKKVKSSYKKILRKLARVKKNAKLGAKERKIHAMVKNKFWAASNNIRAQLGQKDRFKEGLQRSGYFKEEMHRIFSEFGIPEELTALPHVESSFQIGAYSKSGAAGIWQFMRSTGKRFMTINYAIDERRDPIKSTVAAAKLLKENYDELESWPLAITAYNHGLYGMKKAKAKLKSDKIVDVINYYRGRRFGFASSNFYASFLAALEVSDNHPKYFPGFRFYKPFMYDSFKLPNYINISALSKHFKMTSDEIAHYNPSLRPPVLKSEQYVPAGFEFHIPKNRIANLKSAYSRIPDKEKTSSQKRTRWYRIHRGDNLTKIAKRFGVTIKSLKDFNQLPKSGRIYAGQVLQLPGAGRIKTASIPLKKTNTIQKHRRKALSGEYKNIVVRKNDTLDFISRKYNVTIKTIMSNNNIKNSNRIYPGQALKIPKTIDKHEKGELENLENMSINKIELAEIESETIDDNRKESSSHLLPVSVKKDPNGKYLVGFIFAETDETIGHYAEWSKVSSKIIRKINGFRYGKYIHLRQKIKIPFLVVTPDVFFQKRSEYHKSIQEDFFDNYKVEKIITYPVRTGITVWKICNEIYDIPLWLLKRYNPNADLENLRKGEELNIPLTSEIAS